jgi:hypothetical protein
VLSDLPLTPRYNGVFSFVLSGFKSRQILLIDETMAEQAATDRLEQLAGSPASCFRLMNIY